MCCERPTDWFTARGHRRLWNEKLRCQRSGPTHGYAAMLTPDRPVFGIHPKPEWLADLQK